MHLLLLSWSLTGSWAEMFAQLLLLQSRLLCFMLPQARKLSVPLDVALTKLKVPWQSKSLHFCCKSGHPKLSKSGVKRFINSHVEPVDNSNIISGKSVPGFILGFCVILDVSGFLSRASLCCRGCLGWESRKMSTLNIFLSHFLTCLRVSEQCGSWVFKSNKKSIKSNPVLNFPFSKSEKKAKVNLAQSVHGAITKFRYKMSLWRSDSPGDEQQVMGLSCCTENLNHKNYKLRVGAPKRENHPFRCLGEWRSIKGTNESLHSWTAAGITWIIHFKLSRCDILTSAEQSFCDSPTLPTLNNFYKPLVTFTVTQPGLGLPPSSTSFYSQCEKRCWNNCTAKNLNRLTDYS